MKKQPPQLIFHITMCKAILFPRLVLSLLPHLNLLVRNARLVAIRFHAGLALARQLHLPAALALLCAVQVLLFDALVFMAYVLRVSVCLVLVLRQSFFFFFFMMYSQWTYWHHLL